jgi:hypothetical protein
MGGGVARMEEMRNAYAVLVKIPERNVLFKRPSHRREGTVEMDVRMWL